MQHLKQENSVNTSQVLILVFIRFVFNVVFTFYSTSVYGQSFPEWLFPFA